MARGREDILTEGNLQGALNDQAWILKPESGFGECYSECRGLDLEKAGIMKPPQRN